MPRTALIVDDSASIREMVAYTLREAGFAVLEGIHGADALEKLGAHRADVIITDLNMPVMDGLQLIRSVRANPSHKGTPILMLTTEADDTKKSAGREAGATGWLVKPFDPEKLVQTVRKVCP